MGKSQSFNIGFTTSVGTVTAATRWGGDAQKMTLKEPESDTYESVFHDTKLKDFSLVLRRADGSTPNLDLGMASFLAFFLFNTSHFNFRVVERGNKASGKG